MAVLERSQGITTAKYEPVNIDIYVHVVAAGHEQTDGYIRVGCNLSHHRDCICYTDLLQEENISLLISLLNNTWGQYGFGFTLKAVHYIIDPVQADLSNSDADFSKLWKRTHKGQIETLNIYIFKALQGPRMLGVMCTSPHSSSVYLLQPQRCTFPDPEDPSDDGCRITYDAVPPLGDEKTALNEIGHWLRLQHTFQKFTYDDAAPEACLAEDNDGISDTPVHLKPFYFLGEGEDEACRALDTCPMIPGRDPTNNHMNYYNGKCRTTFTQGQITRMRNVWETQRKPGQV